MKKIFGLVAAASALCATAATAGWTSSGGRMLSDGDNPWWVQNTTDVTYCVMVDDATASVNAVQIDDAFQYVINFWRTQTSPDAGISQAHLVTQRFTKVTCDGGGTPDLKLIVGEGKLNAEERAFFGDRLSLFAAIAVRTNYDEVNLRGRGFIYVAGDKASATASGPAWSNPPLLRRVIAHEMGHVFGLSHMKSTLMDEDAPQSWLHHGGWASHREIPDFVRSPIVPENCAMIWGGPFASLTLANTSVDFSCMHFLPISGQANAFHVSARPLSGGAEVDLGDFMPRAGGIATKGLASIVKVFLNPRQRVFQTVDDLVTGDIVETESTDSYNFRSVNGWERPMYVTRNMRGASIYTTDTENFSGSTYEIIMPAMTRGRAYGDWWDEE